jgi:hypothetical protein
MTIPVHGASAFMGISTRTSQEVKPFAWYVLIRYMGIDPS